MRGVCMRGGVCVCRRRCVPALQLVDMRLLSAAQLGGVVLANHTNIRERKTKVGLLQRCAATGVASTTTTTRGRRPRPAPVSQSEVTR